jgi:hypothetical protein
MFNILSYKEIANQNDIDIPFYPCKNGYHQENQQQKMLIRVWGKKNPYTLLVIL